MVDFSGIIPTGRSIFDFQRERSNRYVSIYRISRIKKEGQNAT